MSRFDKIFNEIKNNANFQQNGHAMQYIGNVLKDSAKVLPAKDLEEIKTFALSEMERLIAAIPAAKNYREKDAMFFYEDSLFMVFTLASHNMKNVTDEQISLIKKLVTLVSDERVLENAIDDMFDLDIIEKFDVEKVLETVAPITDEYQRGLLFQGLEAYKDKMNNFTTEARAAFAEYLADEMEKLMQTPGLAGNETLVNNLEFAVDVCKYFITDRIIFILEKVTTLKMGRVLYYAAETLLENGIEISAEAIDTLAHDLSYADLTCSLLTKHGKRNLFPKELDNPEYLAKSDLVHWLIYPTELNKEPSEIELLGSIKVKKEIYYVFRYKSDSDNLDEEEKNVWLIGWANENGGTFSNFDKLADYEKKTPEKTLKHIAKKLLK